MDELWTKRAVDLAAMIAAKEVSAVEVLHAHLARTEAVNGELNAIVRPIAGAVAAAEAADRAIANGHVLGPFHGVPLTVKENIDVEGHPTTQGVPLLEGAIAPIDAPVVARMRRAGAIPFARTNMPDFGMRLHTRSSLYGLTKNPFNPNVTAGGSSGGEGSAIAAGMSPMGLGNDIGGSLRNPAFCCGIASLKPTPGRIAVAGSTSPTAPNLTAQIMAVAGPMARTVADVRAMADVLMGPDPRDPRVGPLVPLGRDFGPLRVALLPEPPGGSTSPAVADGVRRAGEALSSLGYDVVEACPPMVEDAHAIWAGLLLADLTVAIKEFDGVMSDEAMWVLQRAIDRLPAATLGSAYELHQRRYVVQRAWATFFQEFPVLVAPVWTEQAFIHDLDVASAAGEAQVSELSRFVAPMNGLGLPAACVPTGLAGGVPVGVQVVGNAWCDDLCLDVAAAIESVLGSITPVTPWGEAVA